MSEQQETHARRSLARSALAPLAVLAIAMAAISPTTSVFLVYGEGLRSAGTGVVWAFVIGAAIALSMALCYAELGSVFPGAGGAYTIVRRALGPVAGGVAGVLFLVLGMVSTASILTSAATYLTGLLPGGLPVNLVALAMMVVITVLSVGRINPAGWVTALMLVLEVAAILAFTVFAFAHVHHGANPFGQPRVAAPGGALVGLGAGGLLAAVVPALFAFNGYDWPLYFTEETRNARRRLPRAVLLAAGLCVVLEVAAVVAASYAIGDLTKVSAAKSPLTVLAHQVMGPTGATVLLVGVVVAMFDTGLAANLGYARIYFAAGRDGVWPGRPLNGFLSHLGKRSQVPTYAFLVLFVGNGILCVFSSLNDLITFTGVVIVLVYALVAVSAVVVRIKRKGERPPLRMPLWPLPPIVALAGIGLALSQQKPLDLVIAGGIGVLALAGYLIARQRLGRV